ncbi:NlpC/P60 family protein [Vibrio sp.]|nr:NlpC/P60 family protein [Vibrio sp.]
MVYDVWKGTPYQLGGTNKRGIDCSAFVQIAYRDTSDIRLPRTTLQQVKKGKRIKYKEAKRGDLIFFLTSRTTRHVGVYLGNKEFMHASTSRGVMISRTDNPYWSSKFWQFRRVI